MATSATLRRGGGQSSQSQQARENALFPLFFLVVAVLVLLFLIFLRIDMEAPTEHPAPAQVEKLSGVVRRVTKDRLVLLDERLDCVLELLVRLLLADLVEDHASLQLGEFLLRPEPVCDRCQHKRKETRGERKRTNMRELNEPC
jgi:hypothetical protein